MLPPYWFSKYINKDILENIELKSDEIQWKSDESAIGGSYIDTDDNEMEIVCHTSPYFGDYSDSTLSDSDLTIYRQEPNGDYKLHKRTVVVHTCGPSRCEHTVEEGRINR